MADLKRCPFCGWKAEKMVIETVLGNKTVIRCTRPTCYLSYPNAFTIWHNGDTTENAEWWLTAAWNRRAEDGE